MRYLPLILALVLAEPLSAATPAFQATKAGVDRDDQLWFWDQLTRRVTLHGSSVLSVTTPLAINVDADSKRGIAALTDNGNTLTVMSWTGEIVTTMRLPKPAGDLAWMNGPEVAVTPLFADHIVAVWNAQTGTRVRTIGKVAPISEGPGQHLARATLVRYEAWRDELVTLNATFGRIAVFNAAGSPLRQTRVPEDPLPIHEFLNASEPDETIIIWRHPSMYVSRDGTAWISARQPSSPVTLYAYWPDGTRRRVEVQGCVCAAARVVFIGNELIVFNEVGDMGCGFKINYHEMFAAAGETMQIDETSTAMRRLPLIEPESSASCPAPGYETSYTWIKDDCECKDLKHIGCWRRGGCEAIQRTCSDIITGKKCELTCYY